MIQLRSTNNSPINLEFDMSVSGMSEMAQPTVNFAIITKTGKLSVLASRQSGNHYSLSLADTLATIAPGEYECQFEVSIGDRCYVPLKDHLTYEIDAVEEKPDVTPEVAPAPEPAVEIEVGLEVKEEAKTEPKKEQKVSEQKTPHKVGSLFKQLEETPAIVIKEEKKPVFVLKPLEPHKVIKAPSLSEMVADLDLKKSPDSIAQDITNEIISGLTTIVLTKTRPTITKKETV